MNDATLYDYRVVWDANDQVFIGRVTEFPSLAAHGNSLMEALQEIQNVVAFVLEDLALTDEH